MIFVSPTKRGRPWKPLGIVGAAVGFGKRPRIGVVLSCLLWSTCICMAGQRTQLTVERVRKKEPAPAWVVGFCSLPKFAPPSELLLQMGLSEWKRAEGGGREADEGFMVCAAKMSIWDIITGLVKTHFPQTFSQNLPVDLTFSCQCFEMSLFKKCLPLWINNWSEMPPHVTPTTSLQCKGWVLD